MTRLIAAVIWHIQWVRSSASLSQKYKTEVWSKTKLNTKFDLMSTIWSKVKLKSEV